MRSSSRRTSPPRRARPPNRGASDSASRMRPGTTTGSAWSSPKQQWPGLKRHADERQLLFLSSPFSIEAVELLERVGVAAWKIASGELATRRCFAAWPRRPAGPAVVRDEPARGTRRRRAADQGLWANADASLQCTTAYPCPPEKVGLNLIPIFRARYGCPVGLSDHSGTIYPGLAAATLGIATSRSARDAEPRDVRS